MATVMTRETRNFEDVPVFCYGIDADSYEEAYTLATRMFTEDKEEYLREQAAELLDYPDNEILNILRARLPH